MVPSRSQCLVLSLVNLENTLAPLPSFIANRTCTLAISDLQFKSMRTRFDKFEQIMQQGGFRMQTNCSGMRCSQLLQHEYTRDRGFAAILPLSHFKAPEMCIDMCKAKRFPTSRI